MKLLSFLLLSTFSITIASEKKDWIFITEMPGNQETDYYRIKDGKLELNKNEIEQITWTETFGDMIAEAQNKKIPFFLVMIRSGKGGEFIHFFEGKNAFRYLMEKWQQADWLHRGLPIEYAEYPWLHHYSPAYLVDPANNEKATNITIFVMTDDGKFTLLKDKIDVNYLTQFVDLKKTEKDIIGGTPMMIYTYMPKNILTEKGNAQLFIAELFKERAQQESKQKQKLLQLARQWYNWALKYLSPGSAEYAQAQTEGDKIPVKSQIKTQPITSEKLKNNLHTLTVNLRSLSYRLHTN